MRRVMIGMAGHIDHGKSALVRRLTGVDMDRLKEEKARGLTIDLGFAPFHKSKDLWVGIVDVPGHERFVRNMVAGATGVDLVCLVVAADDGVMPQTREHLQIAGLLGVRAGVVALNKADLVDADARELALDDLRRLVKGTFLEGAPVLPVSAHTGEGIEALKAALLESARKAPEKDREGVFRLPVQRVFSVPGFGTVVTGIPFAGRVRVDDRVEILPAGLASRVRGIQAYGEKAESAEAGHSVALNLAEVSHRDVARGDVVAAPGFLKPTRVLELRLRVLPNFPRPFEGAVPVRLHVGTAEVLGTAFPADRARIAPGEEGIVEVRLEAPVAAAEGDHALLRWQSPAVTLGGGRVLGLQGLRRGKLKGKDLENLQAREAAARDPETQVRLALERFGRAPAALSELRQRCLLPEEALTGALEKAGVRVGTRWISASALAEAEGEVLARLEAFHKAQPLLPGQPPAEVRESAKLDPEVMDVVLARLVSGKRLVQEGGVLRLPAHGVQAQVQTEEGRRLADLAEFFRKGGLSPPDAGPADPKRIEVLVKQGVLVRAGDGILFHRDPLAEARAKVVAACQASNGELTTPKARELFAGVSRKYLIPLLEQFDKEGLTRRTGNSRFLRTAMRK